MFIIPPYYFPAFFFLGLLLIIAWWIDRDRIPLNAILSAVLALVGIVLVVFVVPSIGLPLLLAMLAGCLLGGGLVLYRRFG